MEKEIILFEECEARELGLVPLTNWFYPDDPIYEGGPTGKPWAIETKEVIEQDSRAVAEIVRAGELWAIFTRV